MQIEIWYVFLKRVIFCRIKKKKPQKNRAKKCVNRTKISTHFIVQYTICWSFNGSLDLWRKKYKLGNQLGQKTNFNSNTNFKKNCG